MSQERNTKSPTANQTDDARFWTRLRSGDFGLPKTFWLAWFLPTWLLGFLVETAATITLQIADTTTEVVVAFVAVHLQIGVYLTYFALSSIWTWRAARKHPTGWALVAKIVIGVQAGTLLVGVAVYSLVLILGFLGVLPVAEAFAE